MVSNAYCVLCFCFVCLRVPYVASFSGLSMLIVPSVFSNIYWYINAYGEANTQGFVLHDTYIFLYFYHFTRELHQMCSCFYIVSYMKIGSDVSLLLYYILHVHENWFRCISTFILYLTCTWKLVQMYLYFYIISYMKIGSDVSLLLYYILHENWFRCISTLILYLTWKLVQMYLYFNIISYMKIGSDVSLLLYYIWLPRYNWTIVESGIKHHKQTINYILHENWFRCILTFICYLTWRLAQMASYFCSIFCMKIVTDAYIYSIFN
jgi:hypothetical protein